MKLTINCKTYSYDVIIQRNILNYVSEYLSLQRKVLILTDDGVPSEYVLKISLPINSEKALSVPVPPTNCPFSSKYESELNVIHLPNNSLFLI